MYAQNQNGVNEPDNCYRFFITPLPDITNVLTLIIKDLYSFYN